MIYLDNREPAEIKKLFVDMGVDFEIKQLPVGDFVSGNVVVERKTMNDFVNSVISKDKRLYLQIENMQNNYEKSLILISGSYKQHPKGKISPKLPYRKMMEIVAKYNIPVIRVANDEQLVYCAIRFLELANDEKGVEVFAKRKCKTKIDRKIIALAEYLDLGISTTRKLYEAGAIDLYVIFDKSKFSIKGIGEKTVKKILEINKR